MAHPEQTLDFSPVAPHRVLFRHTTLETKGNLLQMEVFLSAKSGGPPSHYHPLQEERLRVIRGELVCFCEGKRYVLHAGEGLIIEPEESHSFSNESSEPVYFLNEFHPALDFEYFIEELEACVKHDKVKNLYSFPALMHFLVIFHRYRKEMRLSGRFNRAFGAFLAWLGKLLGYGSCK